MSIAMNIEEYIVQRVTELEKEVEFLKEELDDAETVAKTLRRGNMEKDVWMDDIKTILSRNAEINKRGDYSYISIDWIYSDKNADLYDKLVAFLDLKEDENDDDME